MKTLNIVQRVKDNVEGIEYRYVKKINYNEVNELVGKFKLFMTTYDGLFGDDNMSKLTYNNKLDKFEFIMNRRVNIGLYYLDGQSVDSLVNKHYGELINSARDNHLEIHRSISRITYSRFKSWLFKQKLGKLLKELEKWHDLKNVINAIGKSENKDIISEYYGESIFGDIVKFRNQSDQFAMEDYKKSRMKVIETLTDAGYALLE